MPVMFMLTLQRLSFLTFLDYFWVGRETCRRAKNSQTPSDQTGSKSQAIVDGGSLAIVSAQNTPIVSPNESITQICFSLSS